MTSILELKTVLEEFVEAADWYRRNLEDVIDRRPVRGFSEARAGYDNALMKAHEVLDNIGKPPEIDCKCGRAGEEMHTCPYKSEINNDDETLCNCCAECAQQCAWDI